MARSSAGPAWRGIIGWLLILAAVAVAWWVGPGPCAVVALVTIVLVGPGAALLTAQLLGRERRP